MKKALLGLATLFVAASVPAQIDAGPFVRTFTSTLTRGFYFQVPTGVNAMIVTHAVVPDEKKTAGNKQIIAIYRLKAAPPAFSATVSVTPVFYKDGVDRNTPVPVVDQTNNNKPLIYKAGEWFAVMGAMGKATGSVDNSYGNAQVPSTVLGKAITLRRCGIQANISGTKGKGAMWSENAGPIGRVCIYVAGHAAAMPYGTGSGTNPGDLEHVAPPIIGKRTAMLFRPGATNNTGGLLGIGLLRANIRFPFGTVLITPVLALLPVPGGKIPATGATIAFTVPNNASLAGTKLVIQGVEGRPSSLALTNGLEFQIQK